MRRRRILTPQGELLDVVILCRRARMVRKPRTSEGLAVFTEHTCRALFTSAEPVALLLAEGLFPCMEGSIFRSTCHSRKSHRAMAMPGV